MNTSSYFRNDFKWEDVVNPITDEEVRAWIQALKSGDYEQGHGYLWLSIHSHDEYCCLGVLAKLHDLYNEGLEPTECYLSVEDLGEDFETETTWHRLPGDLQVYLANLNDSRDYTFEDIANIIEIGFFGGNKTVLDNAEYPFPTLQQQKD